MVRARATKDIRISSGAFVGTTLHDERLDVDYRRRGFGSWTLSLSSTVTASALSTDKPVRILHNRR